MRSTSTQQESRVKAIKFKNVQDLGQMRGLAVLRKQVILVLIASIPVSDKAIE